MKTRFGLILLTSLALSNLTACSYIKSLFPDKEKDYQYTTEIAPLILPEDLKRTATPQLPTVATVEPSAAVADVAPPITANAAAEPVEPASDTRSPPAPAESGSDIPNSAISVERVQFADGENRLRINVPFAKAWRIVGKALTRKSIEVTERDQTARLFTVHYDPDEQMVADDSYWDELVFMVKGLRSNDYTYLLKLEEQQPQKTDIVVLDEDQQLTADESSIKLLNLLEATIKADLAKNQ